MDRSIALAITNDEITRGVGRYTQTIRNWQVNMVASWARSADELPQSVSDIAGLIIQPTHGDVVRALMDRFPGLPIVNVSSIMADCPLPTIIEDNLAIGRMAGEYFLSKGYTQFAFCGQPEDIAYSEDRYRGFREACEGAGFDTPRVWRSEGLSSRHERNDLLDWLKQLPRPTALLCCHDSRAFVVLQLCADGDVSVPDELAVLGVDNAAFFCAFSHVPLSSVQLDFSRIGLRSATLLDRLIDGALPPQQPLLIAPLDVIERESTAAVPVEDPVVAQAMRFIRDHAMEDISNEDIAAFVDTSTRTLERKFRDALDSSPRQELIANRIRRASKLLEDNDLSIQEISEMCGFTTQFYFSRCFSKQTGLSPSDYRKQMADRRRRD